jgi:hypothetical protein
MNWSKVRVFWHYWALRRETVQSRFFLRTNNSLERRFKVAQLQLLGMGQKSKVSLMYPQKKEEPKTSFFFFGQSSISSEELEKKSFRSCSIFLNWTRTRWVVRSTTRMQRTIRNENGDNAFLAFHKQEEWQTGLIFFIAI